MDDYKFKDISTMPIDKLVLVYSKFSGCCLRTKSSEGSLWDENEFLDDSEIDYTHWCELPKIPEE